MVIFVPFQCEVIKAVIYDMDGLLIDSEPFWREAETKVFQSIGLPFNHSMCRQTMGMRIDQVVEYWHRIFNWVSPSVEEVTRNIIEELIALVKKDGKLLPGVLQSIEYFKSHQIPLSIASSSTMEIIEAVVDTLDIRHHFDIIHSAEFEKYGKPHPQVFLTTAEKLNTHPENCLVFEDSKHGMIAGLSARMKVIVVPENPEQDQPWHHLADLKLNTLLDLPKDLLNSL